MNITLRQLEYFRATARTNTLKEAAVFLNVSASTLTAGLNDLEQAVGSRLLSRRKAAGTYLTEEGQRFLNGTITALNAVEELISTTEAHVLTGTINVGCYISFLPTVAPPIAEAVESAHPDVKVNFIGGTGEDLLEMLRSGSIDLALLYHFENWPDVEAVPLFNVVPHIDISPDHELAQYDVIEVQQLQDQPMIYLDSKPAAEGALNYLRSHGILPTIARRSNHFEHVRSLVARGEGFALLVTQPASQTSYEGLPIVRRPVVPSPPHERFVMASIRNRPLTAIGRTFQKIVSDMDPSLLAPTAPRNSTKEPGTP